MTESRPDKTYTGDKRGDGSLETIVKPERNKTYALHFLLRQTAYFLLGGLFAQTRLFEGLPSFAVALAAAAPKNSLLCACMGAVGGSFLLTDNWLSALIGAATVAACGMIRFALQIVTESDIGAFPAACTAFLCCAAAGTTTLLGGGWYLSGVLQFLCDGVLAGSAAYFFVRTRTRGNLLRQSVFPTASEALAPAAAISVLLLSLCFVRVYVFVPARMAAAFCVLLGAELYAEAGGACVGVLCGVTMEIACGTAGLACCFSLGGLLSGLLSRRRRVWIPVCMAAVAALYPLLTQDREAVAVFAETAAACGLYCAIPKRRLRRMRPGEQEALHTAERQDAALRDTLRQTARVASRISPYMARQQLRQGIIPGTQRMTARVRELACRDCAGALLCWDAQQAQTTDALSQCFARVHKQQGLSPDTLPDELHTRCTRRNMLSAACVQAYAELAHVPEDGREPPWMRDDPFSAASALLRDTAERCVSVRERLPRESEDALHLLRTYGVPAVSASCFAQDGRLTVSATADPCTASVPKAALTAALGKLCGCSFSLPVVTACGERFRWRFCQSLRLRLRTGTAQRAADGRRCGDFFLTYAQDGKQVFLLSDGMGTGEAAQLDAEAAAEIFASLLRADVGADCALRMVNTALLRREDAESIATLDAVRVDLYTGKAEFFKAGAAPSYLLHAGKTESIEMPCMPIGILPQAQFCKTERTLQKGDVLVLASDGVCGLHDVSVRYVLGKFDGGSANTLAEAILRRASEDEPSLRPDDATVLAVVVE